MDSKLDVLQLLTSNDSRLFISSDEYRGALINLLPVLSGKYIPDDDESYKESVREEFKLISSQSNPIRITDDFTSDNIQPGTLAYHRIKGLITSSSWWYFSTKDFERDLLAAEANPNITCHFLHITSGGGEAWYLDRLSETMLSLSKPIYSLIEKNCASAAYYIGCHGKIVKVLTQNDSIGCIGTMVSFWDMEPYFESLGFKKIEEFAKRSDLKNKKYTDLRNGKPEQFIKEELDPLSLQFIDTVKNARSAIASLKDDHPVLRGETYMGIPSIDVGLIDGIINFSEALSEAVVLGDAWMDKRNKQRNKALSLI